MDNITKIIITNEDKKQLSIGRRINIIMENRFCTCCGKPMNKGYIIENGLEYFCSDECLHKYYSEEEYNEMYKEDLACWTEWYEEDLIQWNEWDKKFK